MGDYIDMPYQMLGILQEVTVHTSYFPESVRVVAHVLDYAIEESTYRLDASLVL